MKIKFIILIKDYYTLSPYARTIYSTCPTDRVYSP